MSSSRGTSLRARPGRGQTALIGIVLLIGLVATVSVGIFLVAGDVITSTEQQTEDERIEQAFVEMGHTMSTAAADGEGVRSVQFDAGDSGAVAKTEAGWINISSQGLEDPIEVPIGAIEYEGDDGTIVAYQSGGVWKERGNQTRMLSAPNIEYDPEYDTLWFPMSTVAGEETLHTGEIQIAHDETDPMDHVRFVENESITLTVQSEYYRGWEQFFRDEAGGASIQDVDHENQTVEALFGYADLEDAFGTGATIGGGEDAISDSQGNTSIIGDEYEVNSPMPPMDPVIEDLIEDRKSADDSKNLTTGSSYTEGDDSELTNGTYYVDEINGDAEYDVDLTEGDVTLVVEGDVDLEGAISVIERDENEEHDLRIYSGGDVAHFDGDVCVDGCNGEADAIQFYGPSSMAVSFGPTNDGTFQGILYVASGEEKDWWDGVNQKGSPGGACDSEDQVHIQAGGDTEFNGSMVAYSACAHSNAPEFGYSEDLEDADIDPYPDGYELPPQITYLNIAVHELDVTNG